MTDKEDYLTCYRVFFENFAATVNPEDQLPVNIAGYTITEAELPGEVLYWTTQYLTEKECPPTLMTPLLRIILDEVRVASKKQPNDFGYKADESVYIALRLMQAVTARVNHVCLRYLDNSRLDSLPPPPPLAQREPKTVSCATKNSRRVMEDRHVEIGNLEALFGIETTEPTSFYAVYDGHAGSAAATYCAAHLHQYLVESPHFRDDLRRAMRDSFLRTDAEFVRKSNQERACGGSTAVTVAVRGRRLLAAWAGDSLALLAKRMRLMQLVRPHKPGREDERKRIESAGGTVMYWGTWRVNGQLAVSRAIGDAQYKPYVTARPEIATVDLDGDEDFVVVACDGLWDFVSEDDVALAVYRQLTADPDDLKAVTKRLIVQAKRQGSADNISIIVVFLKDPRDIAADNTPPMDLGLDNALANAPPFADETEACKRPLDGLDVPVMEGAESAETDNGVDNSDSDSEDLGPETAVDADDIDADRNHEPAPPTPPAHTVEEGHVDGALVDNVAESGEESEDEWNYYKGEGDRDELNASEEHDEQLRSETPCQDNSAWESSSVDMNSSPLNPDAPVFVPGSVAGADVLLAESPRKPLPMDDNELPDVAQFEAEAEIRPAELLDLDNSDQLNGHHNVSIEEAVKEHFNGNNTCNMDSLGFGFNVGVEHDKVKDTSFIQDFERIQKDTTDFCDIQVFQAHTDTNPFAADGNEELFERLKNKERDPMSMSFYQEKDDDTCERLSKNDSHVDLNAVQTLPDSDDEDLQTNGVCDNLNEVDKENINPDEQTDLVETEIQEPNNDILRFDDRQTDVLGNNVTNFEQGDNFIDYNVGNANNVQNFVNIEFESSNLNDNVLQTDTPESHKLLFEQIPEIPDGKSSELGFTNEDNQDASESERDTRPFTPQEDTSQDIEMESKFDDSPCVEMQPELTPELKNDLVEALHLGDIKEAVSPAIAQENLENKENEITSELTLDTHATHSSGDLSKSPVPDEKPLDPISPEPAHDIQEDIIVDVHQNELQDQIIADEVVQIDDDIPENDGLEAFDNKFDSEILAVENIEVAKSPLPTESPLPEISELQSKSPLPTESPAPVETPEPSHLPVAHSPLPTQSPLAPSPIPTENVRKASPLPVEVPLPRESPVPSESPAPTESPLPVESLHLDSSIVRDSHLLSQSPLPNETQLPSESPVPAEGSDVRIESPLPVDQDLSKSLVELQENRESLIQTEIELPNKSPVPAESQHLIASPLPTNEIPRESPLPVEIQLPSESPLPTETQLPSESPLPVESQLLIESTLPVESQPSRESPLPVESSFASESLIPVETHIPSESPLSVESNSKEISLLEESEFPAKSPLPSNLLSSEVQIDSREHVEPETLLRPETASPLPVESPVPVEESTPIVEISAPIETTTLPEETSKVDASILEDVVPSTDAPFELEAKAQDVAVSPTPIEAITEPVCERLSPEVVEAVQSVDITSQPENTLDSTSGPTPDIVPEERVEQRSELVTDIDIGIPESRAQEICVPVTSEIKQEDAVQAATPPPTPAVEVPHAPETLNIPSLSETPIAADIEKSGVVVATAAVAAAGVGVAAAVAAAKTKKSPATPTPKSSKPALKSTTPRTPTTKPTTTPAKTPSRTPTAVKATPTSAARPATKAPTPITRTAPKSAPTSKPATPASKAATPASKATTPAKVPTPTTKPSQMKPISKPSAKPAPVKEAPVAAKTTTTAARAPVAARTTQLASKAPTRPATAPAAKPAPKPAVPRSAPSAARPAVKEAPKPKVLEKKPITNGDVKVPTKTAPRPATTTTTTARPAPKPRVPLSAAAPAKTTNLAPKPAPRAAARTALDKQSKDLANKRITAKAAPPRTAVTKASQGPKPVTARLGAKKSIEAPKKELQTNGLSNGSADAELTKPPLSPPLADNALLPDVIA